MISTTQNGYQLIRNGDEDSTPPKTGSNVGFGHFHKWELIRLCKRYHKNIYKLIGQKMALKDKVAGLEQENAELKEKIEKLKANLSEAIEDANRWEETETFSVLSRIYNENFEVITSVSN